MSGALTIFGVWFCCGNCRGEGWVAVAPSAEWRLPRTTYLGGEIEYGHTDEPPMRMTEGEARQRARDWGERFPGSYAARALPDLLVRGFGGLP